MKHYKCMLCCILPNKKDTMRLLLLVSFSINFSNNFVLQTSWKRSVILGWNRCNWITFCIASQYRINANPQLSSLYVMNDIIVFFRKNAFSPNFNKTANILDLKGFNGTLLRTNLKSFHSEKNLPEK